ncbi:MAG: hemerythrin domain-containing protein [Thermoprotei archaeon]
MVTESVLRKEHAELNRALTTLAARTDGVGELAKQLLQALRPHQEREEELVLPILEALGDLAIGGVASAEKPAELAGKLSAEYHIMFREHEEILDRVNKLCGEAEKVGDKDAAQFGEHLKVHIALEETVLYPAALVASKYAEKMAMGEIESYGNPERGEFKSFGAKGVM